MALIHETLKDQHPYALALRNVSESLSSTSTHVRIKIRIHGFGKERKNGRHSNFPYTFPGQFVKSACCVRKTWKIDNVTAWWFSYPLGKSGEGLLCRTNVYYLHCWHICSICPPYLSLRQLQPFPPTPSRTSARFNALLELFDDYT